MSGINADLTYSSLEVSKAPKIILNYASLLKIPTKSGFVGNVNFNTVKLARGNITGLFYNFREDSSGQVVYSDPYIMAGEALLYDVYHNSFLENGVLASMPGKDLQTHMYSSDKFNFRDNCANSSGFRFRNNQKVILNHITDNLVELSDILLNNLVDIEYNGRNLKNVINYAAINQLNEEYGTKINIKKGSKFQHFSTQKFSRLIRKLKLENN